MDLAIILYLGFLVVTGTYNPQNIGLYVLIITIILMDSLTAIIQNHNYPLLAAQFLSKDEYMKLPWLFRFFDKYIAISSFIIYLLLFIAIFSPSFSMISLYYSLITLVIFVINRVWTIKVYQKQQ